MHIKFLLGDPRGIDHLGYQGIDRRIMINKITEKQVVKKKMAVFWVLAPSSGLSPW
jgi:hypothetical protein